MAILCCVPKTSLKLCPVVKYVEPKSAPDLRKPGGELGEPHPGLVGVRRISFRFIDIGFVWLKSVLFFRFRLRALEISLCIVAWLLLFLLQAYKPLLAVGSRDGGVFPGLVSSVLIPSPLYVISLRHRKPSLRG